MPFYWFKDLPSGVWDLDSLEEVIIQRYQSYFSPSSLLEYSNKSDSIDSVGHLFMCLITVQSPDLKNIILNGELKLFQKRLNTNSQNVHENMCELVEYLDGIIKGQNKMRDLNARKGRLKLIKNIVETVKDRTGHVFSEDHKMKCKRSKLILPFTFPFSMVAKREVELKNGQAFVYCGKWKMLLECVFNYLFILEVDMIKQQDILMKAVFFNENDQIRQVLRICTYRLTGMASLKHPLQKASDIDNDSQFFPPCMANLLRTLRKSHRLSYESRYQFTLFLKDIGLPVDENILFWREEYSKPQLNCSCLHDWEGKKTRYTYQIRHAYGLLGAHATKESHSCTRFIEPLNSKMDGGCPFQHFSEDRLRQLIPQQTLALPDIEDIFEFKKSNEPQRACVTYLRCRLNNITDRNPFEDRFNLISEINSPKQYYYLAKSNLKGNFENRV